MTDKPHHPLNLAGEPRAFFGRRSGKRLHSGQNALYRDLLPKLEIALGDGELDPRALFQRRRGSSSKSAMAATFAFAAGPRPAYRRRSLSGGIKLVQAIDARPR